jgi:hypothetical protein
VVFNSRGLARPSLHRCEDALFDQIAANQDCDLGRGRSHPRDPNGDRLDLQRRVIAQLFQ